MNTKQQNILRALLKKYKYKNVSNMVRQAIGINYENFLQKTEPLYIVPRIASCYSEEDKKKELMGIVYKEWLKDVVEKHWIAPLNEYSNEHGERTVLSAIYYLIDNGLWDVYEGRLALDVREDNYYDKLSDMPSAIAIVLENQKEEEGKALADDIPSDRFSRKNAPDAAAGESGTDVNVGTKSQNDGDKWPFDPDYILNADEASSLIGNSTEICAHLKQNLDRLANYIYTAADTDVLRNKINKQQQQMEEQKALHQKEITDLQKRIDELKAKADDANATMNKASDYISKLKHQADEAQKQYDELNAKYNKALDERDDADKELAAYKKLLEEEASKEQLPKKKRIPYSALDAVPLLGKGVMTGLVPVLEKYNIVVDYNK